MDTETTTSTSDRVNEQATAAPTQPLTTAPPLEYDQRTRQITRGQMRFFLLLLTINTFLFGAFICLPLASPFLKKMWEDYQAQREQRRQVAVAEAQQKQDAAKLRGLIDACLQYTAPADDMVYAEAEDDVAKLLAAAGRAYLADGSTPKVRSNGGGGGGGGLFGGDGDDRIGGILRPAQDQRLRDVAKALKSVHWQPPAARKITDPLAALIAAPGSSPISTIRDENAVFLHEMKTPAGQRRLVWVSIISQPTSNEYPGNQERLQYDITLNRRFNAYVFDQDADKPVLTSALIQTPTPDLVLLINNTTDGKVELQKRGQWRVFAGQPDKGDASHFTIAYDIDGKPGVIDGRLTDGDRLMLEPRVGRLNSWKSGEEYVWDLADATPITVPVK
jgi:hypothetical protein